MERMNLSEDMDALLASLCPLFSAGAVLCLAMIIGYVIAHWSGAL